MTSSAARPSQDSDVRRGDTDDEARLGDGEQHAVRLRYAPGMWIGHLRRDQYVLL